MNERIEMTRWPNTLVFYGHTEAGVEVKIELDVTVWQVLGEPETFILRVR
jgi:hypothetical protein